MPKFADAVEEFKESRDRLDEAMHNKPQEEPLEERDPRESPPAWPNPPDEAAYHGLAGNIVRLIEPHSEADPVALLTQFLAAFGNIIGRSAHFIAEDTKHALKIFAVLVGATSKSRKGSSWARIRNVFAEIAPEWVTTRIFDGLSSGEGLIWSIRDPIIRMERVKKGKKPSALVEDVEYHDVVVDEGIADKRVTFQEPEFSRVLRMSERDGNTLSAIIRNAWDGEILQSMTKNSPARSTGAHVSIIAHITKDELRRDFSTTDSANGFGNRFLFTCVSRSKSLPEGGSLSADAIRPLMDSLKAAMEFAQGTGELTRDADARDLWHQVYPSLSEGAPGLLGAITGRAEAQVMRLACIYALLDCSAVIRDVHLTAALALWEYCEASARFIFGHSLGDPVADELLNALRSQPEGLTRTQMHDVFGRNKRSGDIARALGVLLGQGLARSTEDTTGGRKVERWTATKGVNAG